MSWMKCFTHCVRLVSKNSCVIYDFVWPHPNGTYTNIIEFDPTWFAKDQKCSFLFFSWPAWDMQKQKKDLEIAIQGLEAIITESNDAIAVKIAEDTLEIIN